MRCKVALITSFCRRPAGPWPKQLPSVRMASKFTSFLVAQVMFLWACFFPKSINSSRAEGINQYENEQERATLTTWPTPTLRQTGQFAPGRLIRSDNFIRQVHGVIQHIGSFVHPPEQIELDTHVPCSQMPLLPTSRRASFQTWTAISKFN